MHQRQMVVPLAKGHVLEIGIGSGLNFQFYNSSKVKYVWGLEPTDRMRKMAKKRAVSTPFEVEFIDLSGGEIPLASKSVNTVLVTYTLCTIPDLLQALGQRIKAILEKISSSDPVKEKAEAETLEFLKEKLQIIAATLRAPTAGNMMLICGAGLLASRVSTKKK